MSNIENKMAYFLCNNCQTEFKSYFREVLRFGIRNGDDKSLKYRMRCPSCGNVCEAITREQYLRKMYNSASKINTVSELIEMLTILLDGIDEKLSPQHKSTVIMGVYPDSAKFVIDEAINYLQSTIDD